MNWGMLYNSDNGSRPERKRPGNSGRGVDEAVLVTKQRRGRDSKRKHINDDTMINDYVMLEMQKG